MPVRRRIAIIGGGAAGACLLGELLSRPNRDALGVDWYTGAGAPGRGVAYAPPSARPLLNVRAAAMGLFADAPHAFLEYVQRAQPSVSATDFLPRRRYGDYLESEVARALQQGAANGHLVKLIPFAADALIPQQDHFTVRQDATNREVDAVVLALGALPPRALPGVAPQALASGRYVIDPWQFLARSEAGPAPRHVLVLGLGLTAVDVLLELSSRWPQASFTALSRHGLLPATHHPAALPPDPDAAQRVAVMHHTRRVRAWVRLLREATAQGEWRGIIDGLRPHTVALWQDLPPTERSHFMRHVRWAWERVRHRMPPQVAHDVEALEHTGRLKRERGRVSRVDADGDTLTAEIVSAGVTRTLHADLVMQTTGLDTDVRGAAHPLIRQLLDEGLVEADPLGLGLLADDDDCLLRGGRPWSKVFAVGSLLRGSRWETTAMPEIRLQARALAERLLAD